MLNEDGSQSDYLWAKKAMPKLKSDKPLFDVRNIQTLGQVTALSDVLREQGDKIVMTNGSFDIIHEGHSMYLDTAREYGDFLIVGVDSDDKIRKRKGPGRPGVPELERLRMVTHQRGVGAVFLKSVDEKKWALIKAVRPHVLIATEETYTPDEIAALEEKYCESVVVLPRMATISTSARLRLMQLEFLKGASEDISDRLTERLHVDLEAVVAQAVKDALRGVTGKYEGGSE